MSRWQRLAFRSKQFDPRSISGLALWLDAADAGTLFQDAAATIPATATNDPVGAWLDKSGNGRHATQATGNRRPLITTSGISGKRSLTTDNVDDVMSLGNISSAFTSAGSGFLVFKTSGTDNIYTVFKTRTNNPVTFSNSSGNFRTFSGAWRTTRLNAIPVSLPYVASDAAVVHTLQASSSAYEMRTNGALVVSAAGDFNAGATYELMGDSDGGVYTLGVFAEALLYSRFLTPSERVRVEAYLAAKWGIALAPQVSNADAQDWINRVYANGGTVSATTASAVNTFCNDIDAAGIRDRFYRLNLFCGNSDASLNAVRTPLFRGPSLGGTQYGNTIDTNFNFVQSDYAETGASGGLLGNGSTKLLRTGLATNTLTVGDRHLSAYEVIRSGATFDRFLGSDVAAAQQFILGYGSSASVVNFGYGAFAANANSSATTTGGHWLGVSPTTTTGIIYKNGVVDGSATSSAATPSSSEIYVFSINRDNSATDFYGGRLGGYSIGAAFTAAQALAYYNAMQTFQTALGRQV